MQDALNAELARRAVAGFYPVSVADMSAKLRTLGYRLDRTRDCPGFSRYVTGPNAGEGYPVVTTGVCEIDTRLSFSHVAARRDDRFRQLQAIRRDGSLFAVVRGRILEI